MKNAQFDKQAHRGGRGLMPENTIPAMLHGMDLGATTLEMDLVISGDRQVVVSHDTYFHEKITTTPEGQMLSRAEALKSLLYNMTYDRIMTYDVGLKPHPDFPRQQKMPVGKPLLGRLLDATENHAKQTGRNIRYNLEIKSKPELDGLQHPPVEEFVELVMAVILEKGVQDRVTIQSFDPRPLRIVHQKYPHLSTALLIEGNDQRSLEEQLRNLGYTPAVYSPHFKLVTPSLIKKCHAQNMLIIPWTVNSLKNILTLKGWGVDGVISDFPDLFASI